MDDCDLCDKPKRRLNKQMIENKCILKTCDDCDEAVIEQAKQFEAEEKLKLKGVNL